MHALLSLRAVLASTVLSLFLVSPQRLSALEGFPTFTFDRVAIDPTGELLYNPTLEFIFPSIIRAADYFPNPLGEYYLYYAPHDNPGGICLAYANHPEGPWIEHGSNPLIANVWSPYYNVAHTSSPHAFWNAEAGKLYLYFHGENDVTRVASSTDGISFTYERACLTRADFDNVTEVSYARVFEYTIPSKGNTYTMLLMCTYGSNPGTRGIYLAWSNDGLTWTSQRTPIISPTVSEGSQISGPHFFPWNGKYHVVYHGSSGNMHITEVGADFELENHLGVFHDSMTVAPDNSRSAAPCFYTLDDTMYMFYEAGQRGGTKIALAKSAVVTPSAPSDLTATAMSSLRVNLAWADNATNELGFKIERATEPDGAFVEVALVGANATTYSDTGLSGATTYNYRVRAYNGAGNSIYTNTATATTPAGGATLTLYSVAAHDGFVVESAIGSDVGSSGSGASLRTGDNADRQLKSIVSFDTSAIPEGATVVSATLTLKRSGSSGSNPFDTLGTSYADIRGGTGFSGSTSLSGSDFQTAADATQVAQLDRPTASNGNISTGIVNSTGRSYVNTAGYTQFRVYFSLKQDGDGGNDYLAWYSGETAVVTDRPTLVLSYVDEISPMPPPAPLDLAATAVSSSQINLTWSSSAGATSYKVKRANTSGGSYLTVATGVATTSYADTTLSPDTTYYYVVSAVNADGESPASDEASATTDAEPPPPPVGLIATAISSSQITLVWSASPDATSYNIKRSTTTGGPYVTIATAITEAGYGDVGLSASTTFYYVVSAVNAAGEGPASDEASATTDGEPPPAPTGLIATAVSSSQINLTWSASDGATSYDVRRSTTSGGPYSAVATALTTTGYSDTGLSANTTYYYVVSAANADGVSPDSNEASATTAEGTSTTVTLVGVAAQDGWLIESAVGSNVGGSSDGSSLRAGDQMDRQLKAIVAFDTSPIPDGATITSATLRLRKIGGKGRSPFESLGPCHLDIRGGTGFGDSTALTSSDFEAVADAIRIGTLTEPTRANGNLSTGSLDNEGLAHINRTGHTQLRVYFTPKHDGDGANDYVIWSSSEAGDPADRPELEVTYR